MWQPIETAPKDGTEIVIWDDGFVTTAYYEETDIDIVWQYLGERYRPTRWMPKNPPEEK